MTLEIIYNYIRLLSALKIKPQHIAKPYEDAGIGGMRNASSSALALEVRIS